MHVQVFKCSKCKLHIHVCTYVCAIIPVLNVTGFINRLQCGELHTQSSGCTKSNLRGARVHQYSAGQPGGGCRAVLTLSHQHQFHSGHLKLLPTGHHPEQ